MEGLGTRLRELRKQAGLSQEKLALECVPSLQPVVIYRIEHGITEHPWPSTLSRIVDVLRRHDIDITSDFLLGIPPKKSSKSRTTVR